MTFAVQRYRNNFSKIYDLFLKDIGTVFQSYRNEKNMTDDRVCCENIAAAMFVTVKEMRAGPS